MFESIKSSLKSNDTPSKFRDILKFEAGKTCTLRLLPNIKEPAKSIFHYYSHAWESFSTGQFLSVVSPTTWNERDPISEARFSILRHGTEEDKEKAQKILRRENWLVNVYVIEDPVNPENNGKVKMMRYGRQIHKIVMEAMEGEDADVFGPRIFDLSKEGVTFKVKCERQGDFPTYVSSKFGPTPSAVPGLTDEQSMKEIYNDIHDLETVFTVKSYDELKDTLDEHYHGIVPGEEGTVEPPAPVSKVAEPEDDVPYSSPAPKVSDEPPSKKGDDDPLNDDKVKELLEGLNS
jgi:hypothetical protein